jgi:putative transposase
VTIVTWHRDLLFGDIMDGEMSLNSLGKIAEVCWRAIPKHFPFAELGVFVIMPNHVHGIIVITDDHIRKRAALLRPNLRPNLLLPPWHVTKPIVK